MLIEVVSVDTSNARTSSDRWLKVKNQIKSPPPPTKKKKKKKKTILTNGRSSANAAPSGRRSGRRRAGLQSLMHPIKTEILLVRAGAAALSLLLIVIQMEAVVLDEPDAEQTKVRPQFVHQLVLATVGSRGRGEIQLSAEDRREYVELLMIEAESGGRQRGTAAAAAATDGGCAPDGTDAACTGTPGTSGQVVSQGDAGLTLLRSLESNTPDALSQTYQDILRGFLFCRRNHDRFRFLSFREIEALSLSLFLSKDQFYSACRFASWLFSLFSLADFLE